MEKAKLEALTQKYLDEVVEARRYIHAHPELSWKEQGTQNYLMEALRRHGIECDGNFEGTAVVGMIRGGKPGRTVALRADMDALPVNEASGCPYSSQNPGVMHACGHDVHTTGLLGAAFLLQDLREELPGNVKLIFQPAE